MTTSGSTPEIRSYTLTDCGSINLLNNVMGVTVIAELNTVSAISRCFIGYQYQLAWTILLL